VLGENNATEPTNLNALAITITFLVSRCSTDRGDEAVDEEPGPLNPLLAASVPRTRLRFVHEGRTERARSGAQGGHEPAFCLVFRYDLSPLLPRLHDPVKPVAVLDASGGRLRLVDAPHTYRIPVRLALERDGVREEREATLVVNKFGLHRLDPAE
jgi:hypothetical protein